MTEKLDVRRSIHPSSEAMSSQDRQPTSSPSHRTRPRPGRRRPSREAACRRSTIPITILHSILVVLSLLCTATAFAAGSGLEEAQRSTLAQMARRGEILVDRRPAPGPRVDLRPRQAGDLLGSSSLAPSTSTASLSVSTLPASTRSSTTGTAASSSTTTAPSSTESPTSLSTATPYSPLPSPFDTSLGNNFTNPSCPTFFQSFLNNSTFKSCLPFSLLLQNSNSFFTASKSVVRITQTLDATCNVALPACSALMNAFALQLRQDANCGQDLRNQNPIVVQAYNGLVAYEPLYHAGCLKDGTGSYCFANAITNTSSPSDSYIYYLPLGIALPGGVRPTCSDCLNRTMALFATAAANRTQPLAADYVAAALQIDMGCGPNFVPAAIPAGGRSGAARVRGMVGAVIVGGLVGMGMGMGW